MKLEQFTQDLKDGTITIDTCGHDINAKQVLKEIVNKLQMVIYHKYWDENSQIVKNLLFFNWNQCYRCGERLELSLCGNLLKFNRIIGTDTCHPDSYRCEFETLKPFVGTININSNLIIANYFKDIVPDPSKEDEYGKYYLNVFKGRYSLAEYMAGYNVAYGQMGNMSIGVFVHPNKKSIIIGNSYYEDEGDDINEIEGHFYEGSICLDVWRWEATDLNTIGDNGYNEHNSVECDVEHGVWQFEHFYDMHREEDREDESPIYSKFTLLND